MVWVREIGTEAGGAKQEYAAIGEETRQSNRMAIHETVRRWSPGGDPRVLETIAFRESRWNHRAEGDRTIAPAVFKRTQAAWIRRGNPWAHEPRYWGASRGLFQAMVPYALVRWDEKAHPWSFFSPIVATAHAARLWNSAIRRGAQNMIDVRMVWAYGPKGLKIPRTDERYQKRLRSTVKRLQSLGHPPTLATRPASASKLDGFGTAKQPGQDHKVAEIAAALGLPTVLPPLGDVPKNWLVRPPLPDKDKVDKNDGSQLGIALGVGAAILGGVLLLAAVSKKKGRR